MAIFKSAYNTLGASYYRDIPRIKEHLFTAWSYGDLFLVKPGVFCVTNISDRSGSIPVFNYPLVLEVHEANSESPYGKHVVVFDARPFLSRQGQLGGLNIRDIPKFQAQVMMATAALKWDQGDVNEIRDMADFPFAVFSWWIAETIGKRYALDNNYQVQIMALAAIWFQSNFVEQGFEPTPQYKAELLSVITRTVGIRIPDLDDIIEKFPVIDQISDFIGACKQLTDSRKLDSFNESVFTSTIGGSWFGATGREQIVVACEYPPVWITLVLQSVADRGYKAAPLTRITERNSFKKMLPNFARACGELSEFELPSVGPVDSLRF